jgi:hypothetical protein
VTVVELFLLPNEAEALKRMLVNYLPALREAVRRTEEYERRQTLLGDEAVIKSLIERLDQLHASQAA